MHILPLSAKEVEKKLLNVPDTWEEVTEKTFDPTSLHPQSGQAVAEAINALTNCYVGTEVSQGNYQGFTLVDGILPDNLKTGDLYINCIEKVIYECTSREDLGGISNYTWRAVSLQVDSKYDATSGNPQSGQAIAEALSVYVKAEEGKSLSSNDFTDDYKQAIDDTNFLVATYGVTTFDSVFAAAESGKRIFCYYHRSMFALAKAHLDEIYFEGSTENGRQRLILSSDNTWTREDINYYSPKEATDTIEVNFMPAKKIDIQPDKTTYYALGGRVLLATSWNSFPNGWMATITISDAVEFMSDILCDVSENGFTLEDLTGNFAISIFKHANIDKFKWFLYGSLPIAEENLF